MISSKTTIGKIPKLSIRYPGIIKVRNKCQCFNFRTRSINFRILINHNSTQSITSSTFETTNSLYLIISIIVPNNPRNIVNTKCSMVKCFIIFKRKEKLPKIKYPIGRQIVNSKPTRIVAVNLLYFSSVAVI